MPERITALPVSTDAVNTDIFPFVNDPAGAPTTYTIAKEDLCIPEKVKLTADITGITTTTLQNAVGLSFPVKNGNYYRFKFGILHRAAATTTGIKLTVTTPSVTVVAAVVDTPVSTAAGGIANIYRDHIVASGTPIIGTGVPATGATFIAEIEGVIVPTADGTLQVQYASEVSTSTVTIKAGSYGMLWKL